MIASEPEAKVVEKGIYMVVGNGIVGVVKVDVCLFIFFNYCNYSESSDMIEFKTFSWSSFSMILGFG